jgi:rubrerythrin
LDAYNEALLDKDWAPVSSAEDPDARISSVVTELDALKLALQLEYEAATFYYQKITQDITTQKVRMLFANIFPMEMGHVVTFKSALGLNNPNGVTGLFEDFSNGL